MTRLFQRRWVRWLREALILIGIFVGVQLWQSWGTAAGVAPALAARDLGGEWVELSPGDGGAVVHFWATWCGVCEAEEGNLEAVEGRRLITVATRSGPASEVASYRDQHPVEGATVLDPDGTLATRWGVRSLPTTFFVDKEGRIQGVSVGYTTWLGMKLRAWWAG